MATEKQIRANRANAQKSTGAITEAGSLASALNNLGYGLCSQETFFILLDENYEKFSELCQSLELEHNPATETERILIRRMAESEWLRARANRLATELLHTTTSKNCDTHRLSLFLRYQTTHERAFYRALKELQSLRSERRKVEIGFESQQLKQAAETRAIAAQTLRENQFKFAQEKFFLRLGAQQPPKSPNLVPQNDEKGQKRKGRESAAQVNETNLDASCAAPGIASVLRAVPEEESQMAA